MFLNPIQTTGNPLYFKYEIMNIFDKISEGIKEAMKAKDQVRLDTLRAIKKEFIEAKTAKGADGELNDETAMKILVKMVKQRKEGAEHPRRWRYRRWWRSAAHWSAGWRSHRWSHTPYRSTAR